MHRLSLLLLAVLACNTPEPSNPSTPLARTDTLSDGTVRVLNDAPSEPGQWRLVEERRIADAPLHLGMVRDLALHPDGTVFVADLDPVLIHRFSASGMHDGTIGQAGSGPGEFADAFLALKGDTVLVQDRRASRVTRFHRDGTPLDFLASACCATEGVGHDRDGHLLVPIPAGQQGSRHWLRIGANDTLVVEDSRITTPKVWQVTFPEGGGFGKYVPMAPTVRYAFDPTGTVLTAWSGEYLIRAHGRTEGPTQFGRHVPARPRLSEAERGRIARELAESDARLEELPVEILRSAYDPMLIPSEPELFDWLWVDPAGHTWVQRVVPGADSVQLDLFDRSGVLLDEVRLPRAGWPTHPHTRPASWTSDRVAVAVEGEAGTEIIIYRVVRK
jgi:hypothetical protein